LTAEEQNAWFVDEVLPLEAMLEAFLRRNWRDADEVADLRQEVYARVFEHGAAGRPDSTPAFVLTTARHLLIDRARRAKIVSIETFADLEDLTVPLVDTSFERQIAARSELRLLQQALDGLPARCREVVALRKIEGLSQRDVAARLGITEDTVEKQVSKGIRALAEALKPSPDTWAPAWLARRRSNRSDA
jgi:RNA polymerase sigma factor (sigma-70 family)